jgi:hypothetical protein
MKGWLEILHPASYVEFLTGTTCQWKALVLLRAARARRLLTMAREKRRDGAPSSLDGAR